MGWPPKLVVREVKDITGNPFDGVRKTHDRKAVVLHEKLGELVFTGSRESRNAEYHTPMLHRTIEAKPFGSGIVTNFPHGSYMARVWREGPKTVPTHVT